MRAAFTAILLLATVMLAACASATSTTTTSETTLPKTREGSLTPGAVKITPADDATPPILYSADYYEPVPLEGAVNTTGGEDSPFITEDGNTLYFFFTPDVSIPAEKQILDGVTGIWVSHKINGQWGPAQRVVLEDEGELALDGAEDVLGNEMWFVTARKGNYRPIDVWIADFKDGKWTNWRDAGEKLNIEYQVGELHLADGGNTLYYHSDRAGGKGSYDIWVTHKVNGDWQTPENIAEVNTPDMEGWPFITADGSELWFTRFYQGTPAIFVSRKVNGQWGAPELVISQFAGEPTLDGAGNIYFVHHFYRDGKMIEADIYAAYHK